jgi:tetratricopeptide (TPR) repeat protein
MNSVLDTLFQANCKIIPYGLITKVVPKNKIPDIQQIKNFNDKEWNRFTQLLPPLNTFADQYSRSRETLFRFGEHFSFLGSYYINEGKSGWALNAFQEARLISPDEVNSIIGEAGLLYKDGRTTDAIKILEEGVKREPSTSQLYQNLGVYYLKILRKDKAYENFKKYLSFNPTDDPDIPSIKNFISSYETNPLIKLP